MSSEHATGLEKHAEERVELVEAQEDETGSTKADVPAGTIITAEAISKLIDIQQSKKTVQPFRKGSDWYQSRMELKDIPQEMIDKSIPFLGPVVDNRVSYRLAASLSGVPRAEFAELARRYAKYLDGLGCFEDYMEEALSHHDEWRVNQIESRKVALVTASLSKLEKLNLLIDASLKVDPEKGITASEFKSVCDSVLKLQKGLEMAYKIEIKPTRQKPSRKTTALETSEQDAETGEGNTQDVNLSYFKG